MIDIKKIHPGLVYLKNVQSLVSNGVMDLASERSDLSAHEKVIQAAQKAIAGGYNQYTDMNGYPLLRENVSQLIEKEYTCRYSPEDEITITAGSAQAVTCAISAFIREGDEVILFEPAFYSYDMMVMANGGRPVYIQLKLPDFHIDWNEVQKVINSRTKMIILNSPHYPTGSVLSAGDMEKLAKIINGTNIILLSDESFDRIVYEGYEHQGVARFPKLIEHSLIFSSFGKALHVEGWKLGYCLAPAKLMTTFRRVHNLQTFAVSTPLQVALSEIINEDDIYREAAITLKNKRDLIVQGLKKSKFRFTPVRGTYFQILNFSDISDEKDTEFCQRLLQEFKIAVMPLSYFYHDHIDQKFVRLCFAKSDETLVHAVGILNGL